VSLERKHSLRKVGAGDYVFLSNDAKTCWRVARYEHGADGPVLISDWPRDEERWGLWRWPAPVVLGETGIEFDVLRRWEFVAGPHDTRQASIDAALSQPSPAHTEEKGEARG